MTNRPDDNDTRKIIVAITDFLRDQFVNRYDIDLQNRCNLEIAAQCLEKAYGVVGSSSFQHRFSTPQIDVFNKVKYPVSLQDKILADAHNEDGNNYMKRNMAISAELEYSIAIELNKWNSIYYCNRASARTEQRRFVVAIADCKQALELNPVYAKAYARMGLAFSLTSSEDRYEEAVRCFRKALELDPGNERYKHNVRVAEGHVNRSGPAQKTTGLLISALRIGPQIYENDNSRILPSTSSAVIDEAGRPVSNAASQTTKNAQISENFLKIEKDKQTNKNSMTISEDCSSIALPTSANKEAKQQPKLKIKLLSKKKDETKSLIPEELVINTPLSTHSINFVPKSQPSSSYADVSRPNVEVMDATAAEKLQNNVSILPQHETEVKSKNTENIHMPLLEDFTKGDKNLQDCDELRSFIGQQLNNLEGKGTTQASVNDIKNKAKHAKKGKEEIAHMPPPKNFKKKEKVYGVSLQEYNKSPSSLIRQKNNSHLKKNTTEELHVDKIKGKTTEAINKDAKQEKTGISSLKDSSRNKQENREISSLNKNSAINSETPCAEISQNNLNKIEYYFTVMQCAVILCSALFYFKWRQQ